MGRHDEDDSLPGIAGTLFEIVCDFAFSRPWRALAAAGSCIAASLALYAVRRPSLRPFAEFLAAFMLFLAAWFGIVAAFLFIRAARRRRQSARPVRGFELVIGAPASPTSPLCPRCRMPMVRRRAKRGAHAGRDFWGCQNYPDCEAIVNIGG